MIRVKLTSNFAYSPFLRQTPGASGRWGEHQFYVNDDTAECDWWVVYEGLDKPETVKCPKDRTVFIIDEPATVKRYNKRFLAQFHTIISCQTDLEHPNVINSHGAHPWMVGCRFILGSKGGREEETTKSYDELKAMQLPLKKDRLISIVSSNKKSTAGHANRLRFTEELKKYFGDKIDVYGRGIKDFADKWDVIAPYKYHIAIENTSHPNYFTEKLVDTFMGGAYPIYYGCPNIGDYLPENSLQKIDINDIAGSIKMIEKCIEEDQYGKSLEMIKKSRELFLDEYNIFPFLIRKIFSSGTPGGVPVENSIIPEKVFNSTLYQKFRRFISRRLGI